MTSPCRSISRVFAFGSSMNMPPKQTMAFSGGEGERRGTERNRLSAEPLRDPRPRGHGGRCQPGLTVGLRVLLQRPQGLAVAVPLHVQVHDLQRERERQERPGLGATGGGTERGGGGPPELGRTCCRAASTSSASSSTSAR